MQPGDRKRVLITLGLLLIVGLVLVRIVMVAIGHLAHSASPKPTVVSHALVDATATAQAQAHITATTLAPQGVTQQTSIPAVTVTPTPVPFLVMTIDMTVAPLSIAVILAAPNSLLLIQLHLMFLPKGLEAPYSSPIRQMVDLILRQALYKSIRDKPACSFSFRLPGH